jgi:hypothetical protein
MASGAGHVAGLALLAMLACCAAPSAALPALADVQAASGCPFVSLDMVGYSTWGFGCRLQVRADGTAFVEGRFVHDEWSADAPHAPRRVGRLSGAQLAELCRLLPSHAETWQERYVQPRLDDGQATLIVLHTTQGERRVFEYGAAGPATLHRVEQALENLATGVTWSVWDGDEADWLAATGWSPLAEWQDAISRGFPPM